MRWAEIALSVAPESVEPVSASLTEAGCAGVIVDDPSAVSSDPFAMPAPRGSGEVSIKGYLPVDDRLEAALEDIERRLRIVRDCGLDAGDGLTLRHVDDETWAEAWKAFFKPLRVGRRFVVRPSWESWAGEPDDLIIEIDPGMAFGTGAHATTRLCLELLEETVRPGERVLDWGTGSGILAVGAARLGAAEVIAVDLDPVAARVASENAARNGFAEVIRTETGSIEAVPATPPFDGVIANILADPIIAGAREMSSHLRSGGYAIISGVVDPREAEVISALEGAGLTHAKTLREEDWRAFLLRRPGQEPRGGDPKGRL